MYTSVSKLGCYLFTIFVSYKEKMERRSGMNYLRWQSFFNFSSLLRVFYVQKVFAWPRTKFSRLDYVHIIRTFRWSRFAIKYPKIPAGLWLLLPSLKFFISSQCELEKFLDNLLKSLWLRYFSFISIVRNISLIAKICCAYECKINKSAGSLNESSETHPTC